MENKGVLIGILTILESNEISLEEYKEEKEKFQKICEALSKEEIEDYEIIELIDRIGLEIGKIEEMLNEVEESEEQTTGQTEEAEHKNLESSHRAVLNREGMPKGYSHVTNNILDVNGEKELCKKTQQYYEEEMEDGKYCRYDSEIIELDGKIQEIVTRKFNGKEEKYIHIKNEQGDSFTKQDESGFTRPFNEEEKPEEGVKLTEHFMIKSGYSVDKDGKTVSQQNYEDRDNREVLDIASQDLLDEIYERIDQIDVYNKEELDGFIQRLEAKIQEGYDLKEILQAVQEYEQFLKEQEQEQGADMGDEGDDMGDYGFDFDPFDTAPSI